MFDVSIPEYCVLSMPEQLEICMKRCAQLSHGNDDRQIIFYFDSTSAKWKESKSVEWLNIDGLVCSFAMFIVYDFRDDKIQFFVHPSHS